MPALFLSLFFLSQNAFAEAPKVLTLNEAVSMALSRKLEVFTAQERVRQAIARRGQALGVVMPQAFVDTYQRRQTRDLGSQGIPFAENTHSVVGPFNSFDVRAHVSQLLFDRSALDRLLTVDALKKVSEAEYRKARQDAAALTASLYLDAVRAEESSELAVLVARRELKRLWISHKAYREGRIRLHELKAVKASARQARSAAMGAGIDAREARYDLLVAVELPLDEPVTLDHSRSLSEHRIPSAAEIEGYLKEHPEEEAARMTLLEKEKEKDIFLSEYWPKISAFADYGLAGDDPPDAQDTYAFGLQGSWNIWDGQQRAHKIEEAQSALRVAERVQAQTRQRLDARSRVALGSLARTSEYLKAKDLGYLAAAEKWRHDQTRFANGSASEWDLLNSTLDAAIARDERDEAAAAYLLSKVSFFHSIGKIEDLLTKKELPA